MEHTTQLIQFLFILSLFAGGALYLVRKMKKRQFNRSSEKGLIRIQDAVQLGLSEKMYVVTVGNERVLITMSNNGVTSVKLNDLSEEELKSFEELYEDTTPNMNGVLNAIRKGFKK